MFLPFRFLAFQLLVQDQVQSGWAVFHKSWQDTFCRDHNHSNLLSFCPKASVMSQINICSRKETSTLCGCAGLKFVLLFWALLQSKVWVCDRHRWFAQTRADIWVKRGWRHPKPGSALMDAWVRFHAGVNSGVSTAWWCTLHWISSPSGQ